MQEKTIKDVGKFPDGCSWESFEMPTYGGTFYHNFEGPAYVVRDASGKVIYELYFLYGEKLTKDEWLVRTSKLGKGLY